MKEHAYGEACALARHYSESSRSVRLLCVGQGVAVLAGAGFLARTQEVAAAGVASLFGFMLGLMLFLTHIGYIKSADSFFAAAAQLEGELGLEGGPLAAFENDHARRFRGWRTWIVMHGPFLFILASCLVLGGWCLVTTI